jgi:hypothetical protein
MITVLVSMSIIKISLVSVGPLIAAATLLEKDLGGELSLNVKNVNSLYG